jgi:hypothetical protein
LLIDFLGTSIKAGNLFDAKAYDQSVSKIDFRWTHGNKLYPIKPTGNVIDVATRIENDYKHYFEKNN